MGLQETFDRFLADMKLEGKADMTQIGCQDLKST